MTPIKRFMHTPLNMAAFFLSMAIFPIGGWVILQVAANRGIMIFGLILFGAALVGILAMFLWGYRIFDRVHFFEDRIERVGLFGKKVYSYGDFRLCEGEYFSSVERKPYVILSPKTTNLVVPFIDTTKRGNLIPANRLGCLYCRNDGALQQFLRQRKDLERLGDKE